MAKSATDNGEDDLVLALSQALRAQGRSVATAESLTGGQLAAALSAAPEARQWYRGGIVAYNPEVKYAVLYAPRGPVVTAETALEMARSVTSLLGANIGVALTGVGGPEPDEGKPAGTVYFATCVTGSEPIVEHHLFAGKPLDVMKQTIQAALRALISRAVES